MAYDSLFEKTNEYSKKKTELSNEFELFTDEEQKVTDVAASREGLDPEVQAAVLDVQREFASERKELEEKSGALDQVKDALSEEISRELLKLNETQRRLNGLSGKKYTGGVEKASERCQELLDQLEGMMETLGETAPGRDSLGSGGGRGQDSGPDTLPDSGDHGSGPPVSGAGSAFAAHERVLGAKFTDRLQEKLNLSPHRDVRQIYETYGSRLTIYSANHLGGAYYEHGKGVHFNKHSAAAGGLGHKPYQTAFHEFGHNIDYLMGNGEPISEKWGNGALYAALQQDFADLKGELSDRQLVNRLRIDMAKHLRPASETLAVSDMIESFTGISYPLGSGHGKKYWEKRLPCKEFFAEVLDGAAANEDSYRLLKQMFPRGVEVVHRIIGGEPG